MSDVPPSEDSWKRKLEKLDNAEWKGSLLNTYDSSHSSNGGQQRSFVVHDFEASSRHGPTLDIAPFPVPRQFESASARAPLAHFDEEDMEALLASFREQQRLALAPMQSFPVILDETQDFSHYGPVNGYDDDAVFQSKPNPHKRSSADAENDSDHQPKKPRRNNNHATKQSDLHPHESCSSETINELGSEAERSRSKATSQVSAPTQEIDNVATYEYTIPSFEDLDDVSDDELERREVRRIHRRQHGGKSLPLQYGHEASSSMPAEASVEQRAPESTSENATSTLSVPFNLSAEELECQERRRAYRRQHGGKSLPLQYEQETPSPEPAEASITQEVPESTRSNGPTEFNDLYDVSDGEIEDQRSRTPSRPQQGGKTFYYWVQETATPAPPQAMKPSDLHNVANEDAERQKRVRERQIDEEAHQARRRGAKTVPSGNGFRALTPAVGPVSQFQTSKEVTHKKPSEPKQAPKPKKAAEPMQPEEKRERRDKWADEEHQQLEKFVRSRRAWEKEEGLELLKDNNLFKLMAAQMRPLGSTRTGSACKNYWNRYGRDRSGFEERASPPKNGSLVSSAQGSKAKKAKNAKKAKKVEVEVESESEEESEEESELYE